MKDWGTILIGLIVLSIVALVVYGMIKDKKSGKSSCGGGCSGCGMSGSCHPVKKK